MELRWIKLFFFFFFLSGIMPERVLTQLEKCPVDCAVIEGSYTLYVRKRKEATTKLTFCFSALSVDLEYRRQLLQPFASSLLVNEENSSMCYLLFFFVCVCVCRSGFREPVALHTKWASSRGSFCRGADRFAVGHASTPLFSLSFCSHSHIHSSFSFFFFVFFHFLFVKHACLINLWALNTCGRG